MNKAIERMLNRYSATNWQEKERALKEVLQEVTLVGLNRANFFDHAALYGGTALRIFYGLDRFSEDLDFTLIHQKKEFSWSAYAVAVVEQLKAFGFMVKMEEKKKNQQSIVKSAFLKANTFQELIKIGVPQGELHGVHPDTTIRIKVEIDINPNMVYGTEEHYLREPTAVSVRCVTEEFLLAGKMHAALFRQWRNRVKGRDWYDMIWFIRRGVPLNLQLFSEMMGNKQPLKPDQFIKLAKARITTLDIESAKLDIRVFVSNVLELQEWSKSYFLYWLDQLTFTDNEIEPKKRS